MEDQIKAAILNCLSTQEVARQKWNGNIVKIPVEWPEGLDIKELGKEIYAAIKPHLPAQESWDDAPEWAEWAIWDNNGNIGYSEKFPSSGSRMQIPKEFRSLVKIEKRPK